MVDNTGGLAVAPSHEHTGIRILEATKIASSYYARNSGVAGGTGEWIVFLDGDVVPPPDLLRSYFDPVPMPGTGVLVGDIRDEPVADTTSPVSRYLALKASMAQANTWTDIEDPYAQTANCAVRRVAFEELDGFRDDIRSGGDADLCFRLRRAGWAFEQRPAAIVTHRNRTALRQLIRQRARHGAGAAWLRREYPGTFPRASLPGLIAWSARSLCLSALHLVTGNRDAALLDALDPVSMWAYELGRLLSNRAPAASTPAS